MTPKRTYGGGCAVSAALDIVGERWALLVIRELLLGPKRFSDLQAALYGASPNVLAQRLRELEDTRVVRRRRLGPPASAWAYELTEWGHGLESVVISLGRWGRHSPFRDRTAPISVDSLVLALRAHFDPEAGGDLSGACELRIADDRFVVRVADDRLDIKRGDAVDPRVSVETDADTFATLVTRARGIDEAVSEGRVRISGDARMFERLIGIASEGGPS